MGICSLDILVNKAMKMDHTQAPISPSEVLSRSFASWPQERQEGPGPTWGDDFLTTKYRYVSHSIPVYRIMHIYNIYNIYNIYIYNIYIYYIPMISHNKCHYTVISSLICTLYPMVITISQEHIPIYIRRTYPYTSRFVCWLLCY